MYNLGIIGLGERSSSVLSNLEKNGKCRLSCVADPRLEEVKKEQALKGRDISDVRFYATAEEMFEHEKPDGILVGTRCSLHAKYAEMV